MFLPTELKNGQQMMASEGVIATLFYRLVNDDQLRSHYRESAFYRSFLPDAPDHIEDLISPAENVNLKLFAAMARLQGIKGDQPPMISLIERYAELFPDEAKRVYAIFIETTWGATVSQQLASELIRAAEDGRRGDIGSFRQEHPFSLLDLTITDVAAGKRALDSNLGPEIWIANSEFKIASPIWAAERRLPLTINLNAATEAELMTIPGVDLTAARKVVAARTAEGFFRNIDALRPDFSPQIMRRLRAMLDEMNRLPTYHRD